MLSNKQVEKLIQPLIDRQLQQEGIVLRSLANRLKELKTLSPSDINKLEQLLKTGNDARDINKQLSKLSKLSEKDIKKIIKDVAKDSYKDSKPFYDYRHKSYIPFNENMELQNLIKSIERVTLQDYTNMSNTTAFMLRDINNPLILHPTKISNLYNTVIDNAIQNIVSGFDSYNIVIPKTIQSLVDSGMKVVEYTTEEGKKHYTRIDSAVKNHILNAIRDVQQGIQDITGEQFGSDGVEISVHQHSAPDHEPIQGHQLTNEEFDKMQLGQSFEDVDGQQFSGFERPIGMWNCRHIVWRVILAHKTSNYTKEQLEDIKKKNANGITVTNKKGEKVKKSMYWCEQKRNNLELQLRELKEGRAMAEKAGQDDLYDKYDKKVQNKINQYKLFCKSCGLNTRFENTRVFV